MSETLMHTCEKPRRSRVAAAIHGLPRRSRQDPRAAKPWPDPASEETPMRDGPRTPVLVGVGVVQQRAEDPREAREPLLLMGDALERAADDAGSRALLARADSIRIPRGFWDYSDPGRALAERFGASAVSARAWRRSACSRPRCSAPPRATSPRAARTSCSSPAPRPAIARSARSSSASRRRSRASRPARPTRCCGRTPRSSARSRCRWACTRRCRSTP